MNRPTKAALNTSEKILDRILCVAGAVLFSQAPEFMQQYLQRLGGHLAEARRHLEQFQNVAKQTGQTLEQLIATSKANADAAIAKLGGVMDAASTRVAELSSAESAIRDASPFTRPFEFLRHVDHEIANATWAVFKPAVPTTLEGVLYASVGLVVLLALYHGLIRQPIAHVYQRRLAKKAPVPAPATGRV
jgi:ABC-type transporter Mla subunit MlaD